MQQAIGPDIDGQRMGVLGQIGGIEQTLPVARVDAALAHASIPEPREGEGRRHAVGPAQHQATGPEFKQVDRRGTRHRRNSAATEADVATRPSPAEGLVVVLDLALLVQVVDHHARRFAQALRRRIRQGVDPFDPGPVGQVKAGHGIERRPLRDSFTR